jgi:O-antigen/teichoic acid export membrane protein
MQRLSDPDFGGMSRAQAASLDHRWSAQRGQSGGRLQGLLGRASPELRRGYLLFGLPPILAICAAGLLAPQLLLSLMYGSPSPYRDAALTVQLLAVAVAAEYVGEMIGKSLLGVGAGRLSSLVILLGLASAVLTLPLIIYFGVVGAALALAVTNVIRLIIAWVAMSWLIAKETSRELVQTLRVRHDEDKP